MSILMTNIKGHDSLQKHFNRALKNNHLPHALLFIGPSGVGKQKVAWALAQNLLCKEGVLACGQCFSCLQVEKEESENILFIDPDSLKIKLEDVRPITPFLSLQTDSPAKIVIINNSERLNKQSVNSLLKIIEEPPQKSFFIFVSSALASLPITLRSRLQIIRFNPLSYSVIKDISSEEDKFIFASQGRLDLLEQFKVQEELRVSAFDLWNEIFKNDQIPTSLESFAPLAKKRKEALFISRCWQQLLRDVRCFQAGEDKSFIHIDQVDLIKKISSIPSYKIDFLIQKTFELEKDLLSNLDCVLCFENFMVNLQQSIKGERYVD